MVLRLIGQLYRLERRWDEAGRNAGASGRGCARRTLRARSSGCTNSRQTLRERALPKLLAWQGLRLPAGHWEPLIAHLRARGNPAGQQPGRKRHPALGLGKKNWLFIGHPDAGQRSAIIYSIVVSCQRHGKDPLAYLRDVLTRLPAMTNQDDLDALTPANWSPAS